jgi:menaquinone-dependent protoporphyrinogen oxidase
MNTLVVYDTRHGFTQKCVQLLAETASSELTLWPLRGQKTLPDFSKFDRLVLGGPVYFGKFAPRITQFYLRAFEKFAHLPYSLFVVGLSPRAAGLASLEKALGTEAVQKAQGRYFWGGAIQWQKLSWWEKFLVKKGRKIETDASNFDLGEVHRLAEVLKE